MNEITYRHIVLKDLVAWAEEIIFAAKPGDFVPITLQRARALAANPYAEAEDVSMIAAYLGERCVGYFGVMPVMVKLGDVLEKVSWFTTWTVAPETQGMGVGSGLLRSALTIEDDFMIVGSHFAVRACEKQGFDRFEDFRYAHVDLRLLGRFNPVSAVLRAGRKVSTLFGKEWQIERTVQRVNAWFAKVYMPVMKKRLYADVLAEMVKKDEGIVIEQVREVGTIGLDAMPKFAFLRDEKMINWMLAHPWVAKTGESATEGMNYYFTDARDEFEMQAFEFLKEGQRVGLVTLMLTKIGTDRRQVRVLDCVAEEAVMPTVRRFVMETARDYGAVQVMGDLRVLSFLGETAMKGAFEVKTRTYQTKAMRDSVFARSWEKITQRFADGDMAFT